MPVSLRIHAVIAAAVVAGGAAPALAASYVFNSGQTQLGLASPPATAGSCYVGRAPSTFARADGAKTATITFGELWVGGAYDLAGLATLKFTSAASGLISFSQPVRLPAAVATARFSGYSQVYSSTARTLTVRFTITFPNCVQPVTAVYRGT